MRENYIEALSEVTDDLVRMSQLAGEMIEKATEALLRADRPLAESVIALDTDMDDLHEKVEEKTLDIMALQAPVASDLRLCVAALRMSQTLERMGDLASHIAMTARRAYPEPAIPDDLAGVFGSMGALATGMVGKVAQVVETRSLGLVLEIREDDDRMDELHKQMFTAMLSADWGHGVDTAVNVTLLSRFYERFADHAESLSQRMVFLITGERSVHEVV
jgi:phosphate transport system protein